MLEYGLRGRHGDTLPFHSAEVIDKNLAAQKKFPSSLPRRNSGACQGVSAS